MLTTSGGNQQFVCFAGYCLSYPFSGGADVTASASQLNWRGLASVDAFGIYSLMYTNQGLYNGGNHTIRSMVTSDGTNFWTTGQAGANGVKYVSSAVNTYATGNYIPVIDSSATGSRVVQVVAGTNLVFSDASTPSTVIGLYLGAGNLPEPLASGTAGSSQFLNEGSFPLDFAFSPDQLTVYVADGLGGIQRWDTTTPLSGYNYSYTLWVDPSDTLGTAGLAVDFSANPAWGAGIVGAKLYATTYGLSSNMLVSVIDNGDPASVPATINVMAQVGTNMALRGVRFGPAAVPPTIIAGPQSQTNFPGNSVTFSVAALGSAPFYYQWYGPSGQIAGATNSSYTLIGSSLGSFTYYAVVSNPTGLTATNSAVLTVTAGAPAISPAALPNYKETVGDHLAWAPTISGTVPITYAWYKSGNPNPILAGTISALGAGNGGLVLTNIQLSSGGTYSLVVTNPYGNTSTTSGGVLTVTTSLQSLFPTNLVVARIGDGAQVLSSATGNTLYLDQYTVNGSYVNTIQYPDEGIGQPYGTGGSASANLPTGSQALLVAGAGADAPYEGILTLSPNGQDLSFVGYVQGYPFAGADLTLEPGGNGGNDWRGIATVDAYGYYSLNYTNSGLYSGGLHQVHSAADIDGNGTNFYTTGEAGGGNAVKYCNVDNQPASGLGIVSIGGSFSGPRVAQVVNENLVFSDVGATPVGIYGFSGLPTAASTPTLLIQETNSPVDFAASPDGATVYIADNGAFGGSGIPAGGIQRWDGTPPSSYTYSYTLPAEANSSVGARALTVDFSAHSTWGAGVTGAKLYGTTAEPTGNQLIEITDNGAASVPATLISAGPAQILSGVRFGPAVVAPFFTQQPQPAAVYSGSSAALSAVAGGSGPFTYQWYIESNGVFVAIGGATNSTYTIGAVASRNFTNYYVKATSPSSATATSATVSLTQAVPPQFISETYLGAGSGIQLNFTGTSGVGYSIRTNADIAAPQPWVPMTTGTFSGGTDNYLDVNGGANPQLFYIITVP
jgi:hypothetical protein